MSAPDHDAAELAELDAFRLRGQELGQLTGVAIAVNGISDAFLLQHIGVGCKHKTTTQLATHDAGRTIAFQTGWTEVGDKELIQGSADRIGPYARTWIARRDPGIFFAASVTFLDLTGDDFAEQLRRVGEEVGRPCVWLKAPGYEGDLVSGWALTVEAALRQVDWKRTDRHPGEVGLLGYLFDRHEGDHEGNLAELARILAALGLQPGPVTTSGVPFARLADTAASEHLLTFPYLRADKLRRITRREVHAAPWPLSLRGADAFVRAVARAAGVPATRAESLIQAERAAVEARLGLARERLRDQRVALLADVPTAAGWLSLLEELGMRPAFVGLRGHTLGGTDALQAALDGLGARLPPGVPVLEQPSLRELQTRVAALLRQGRLDGVLASATELNAISALGPELLLAPYAGSLSAQPGLWHLEIGFPCKAWHCTRPMPFLGYAGVLEQAQRLLDAPRLWDSGRSPRA
jgi:nitrogenase molybdenum-iron protein alpha/beta subunit